MFKPSCVEEILQSKALPFGQYENNFGWIECESKTFPGRIYYFNLNTCCKTWIRPVSKNITLIRYKNLNVPDDSSESASEIIFTDDETMTKNHKQNNLNDNELHSWNKSDTYNMLSRIYYGFYHSKNSEESISENTGESEYDAEDFFHSDNLWADFTRPLISSAANYVEAVFSSSGSNESEINSQIKENYPYEKKKTRTDTSSSCDCSLCYLPNSTEKINKRKLIDVPRLGNVNILDSMVKSKKLRKNEPENYKSRLNKIIFELNGIRTVSYNSNILKKTNEKNNFKLKSDFKKQNGSSESDNSLDTISNDESQKTLAFSDIDRKHKWISKLPKLALTSSSSSSYSSSSCSSCNSCSSSCSCSSSNESI